jgi:glycerol-3-phosphate cytidylyltransferase-like family protein
MRDLAGPHGKVIIALNTDEFVEQFKGHAPVQSYVEREAMLLAVKDVDEVVGNIGGADSRPAIELAKPDLIAVGRDWYSEDDSRYCTQMGFTREWLQERGIRLVYLEWMDGYSSTNLRATARAMTR